MIYWVLIAIVAAVTALMILGTRSPNRLPFEDPYDRTDDDGSDGDGGD